MTPVRAPLDQVVRYEAHLDRQLYKPLAYYKRHRRANRAPPRRRLNIREEAAEQSRC
jgi:hypothetical protein